MPRKIVLQRVGNKKPSDSTLHGQINHVIKRALSGGRGNTWKVVKKPARGFTQFQEKELWKSSCELVFSKTGGHPAAEDKQWEKIFAYAVSAAKAKKFRQYPWLPIEGTTYPEGYEPIAEDPIRTRITKPVKSYGPLSLHQGNHFDHLYDREHQITRTMSDLQAAVQTDFKKRYHVVLHGPPGCGKSDILLSAGRMMGKEGESYLKFDATSTTQAHALNMLLTGEYIPPVLIVEEIEKAEEKSLRWLLGLLDERGEVRKSNCRIGHRCEKVRMVCLATVNDMKLFKSVMSGALASRFANKVYCPRPSRAVMAKILQREVEAVGGKTKWIEPALKFCMDDMQWNDPREIIPVCIQGREKLMDKSYQRAILATLDPDDKPDTEVQGWYAE